MSILASLGSAGSWLLNSAQTVGSAVKGGYDSLNSGVSSILNTVGSFGGDNFIPMASGFAGLFNGYRQNRINEKVYHLNKQLALHGVEIRQRDLKRAGINPILAGYAPAQGGISSPQFTDAVGSGLNNAMALKEAKLKIKGAKQELEQMKLQNKAQELQNESQEVLNNYNNGKYDYYLTNPVALAINDAYTGYRGIGEIIKDADLAYKAGNITYGQYGAILNAMSDYKDGKKPYYYDEYGKIHFWKTDDHDVTRIPLTIRRQFEIDQMQMRAQQQYNETQDLENFLRSYNNAVLPPAAAAKAANTAAPFVSIGRDLINSASQFFPKGAVANKLGKGLPGNNKKGGNK